MAKRGTTISKNVMIDEMRFILEALCDRARMGARPRLSDVRSMLKGNLTLDFADYFKFLKRYNYVLINRSDQTLVVTEEGRLVAEKGGSSEFLTELTKHFGDQVHDGEELIDMGEEESFAEEEPAPRSVRSPKSKKTTGEPVVAGSKYDSKYTRYDAIGSGGIGTVFKGRHNALALDVALKEIKDLFSYFNFLQRSEVVRHLKQVVEQMSNLNHPLIVKIIDENVEVAHPYFVMEFLSGGNLKESMNGAPLPIDRCLTLFTQICYALSFAHRREVVHGNIKPENVLFDELGNVRVTDFGMTRLLQTEADRPIPQVITGSIGYLSPEQMQERSVQTVSSDIYSLGILLYEMLTGNLPGRRSPLPSEVNKKAPKEIDDLFDKMTRDAPEERYPDIDSVLSDFYGYFKDGTYLTKGKIILYAGSEAAGADGDAES
jgi:hypothetical protein